MLKYILIAISLLFLAACSGSGSMSGAGNTDSAKVLQDTRPEELKVLSQKILSDPKNVGAYTERANYYLEHDLFLEAYKDLQTAFSLDSLNPNCYVSLSRYYLSQEQSSNARKALEEGLKKNPENTSLNLELAELLLIAKEYKSSFQYINAALKKDKYIARGYFLKGMNYKEMGKEKEAISGFQTAIEQDPDYYDAYMQLGLLFEQKKDKLTAQYYGSAIRIKEKNPEAWYARAMFYQNVGEEEKARADYRSILSFDSSYFNAWYNLGYLSYMNDKPDSAYYFFDKAVRADYKQPQGYYMRGLCLEQRKDIDRAKADYQQALKLDNSYYLAIKGLERLK